MKQICLWMVLGISLTLFASLSALEWAKEEQIKTGSMRAFADVFFELCALVIFSVVIVVYNSIDLRHRADCWTRRSLGLGLGFIIGTLLVWFTTGIHVSL